MNLHCIKCNKEMEAKIEFEKSVMSVCTNKECILLGVPQIGKEKLEEYFNSLDKKDEKKTGKSDMEE